MKMETKKVYCLKDLESCLIRFLYLLSEIKSSDSKADFNDFEIAKHDLKDELNDILQDIY